MWPQLINTLGWWQWLILAAVPPAIVALYFLKLKRHPVEVPSTYLWHKSVEDLHVNSIWQRLRRNLLLLLQLLVILLMVLALLRPGWRGAEISGDRFICLIDNSASMQATDVQPNRLEEAKRRAAELIDQMESGDAAMIVSFADTARVEREFTGNRRQLRRALDGIRPTQRSTSLVEALKVASGLANPGRSAEDKSDFQVAEALPAKLFIFSDGKFDNVSGFSLGNLEPIYVPIGQSEAANVGIVALSVRRHPVKVGQLQLFARLENFGAQEVSLGTELFLDDRMIDADRVDIAAGESRGVVFDPGTIDAGVLRLRAATDDYLACDDEALVAVNPPRQAAVLLVTPGNKPLQLALGTDAVREIAEVTVESPAFLKTKPYLKQAGGGTYDLVIYDRCAPKEMPRANSLFIGTLPTKGWKAGPKTAAPVIIDSEHTSADAVVLPGRRDPPGRDPAGSANRRQCSDRLGRRPDVCDRTKGGVRGRRLGLHDGGRGSRPRRQDRTTQRHKLVDQEKLPRVRLQRAALPGRLPGQPVDRQCAARAAGDAGFPWGHNSYGPNAVGKEGQVETG